LGNNGEGGRYQTAMLLEKVFNKRIMRQDQLPGIQMGLALEGDKIDKAILIQEGANSTLITFQP